MGKLNDRDVARSVPERDALAEDAVAPIVEALDAKGLTAEKAACLIHSATLAKRYTHHKVRGGINQDLPRGYRKVAMGVGNLEDETLVVHSEPDHAQRVKAAEQIIKLRGLAPKEEKAGIFGGATIIVQSQIPEPDVIDVEEYQPIEELPDE